MENKFVLGEFVVFKGVYGQLYTIACITGDKLENQSWPAIVWDSKVCLHIPEKYLFKIDWERKLESSPIERAVQALESIAESLGHISDALYLGGSNSEGITDILAHNLIEIKETIEVK